MLYDVPFSEFNGSTNIAYSLASPQQPITDAPEPSTLAIFALGMIGVFVFSGWQVILCNMRMS
jgi:hypothetical protein